MRIPLTEQQQQAIDAAGEPPRLVDPRTNAAYVLVPEADYESYREAVEDDRQQRAIRRVAARNAVGRMQDSATEHATAEPGSKEAVLRYFGAFRDDGVLDEQLARMRALRKDTGE